MRCPIGDLLVAKPTDWLTERLVQTVSENPQGTGLGPFNVFFKLFLFSASLSGRCHGGYWLPVGQILG